MRHIAISDIHGHARTFRELLFKEVQLRREDHLYLLGDYIDRGPRSREVLDLILDLQARGYQLTCLAGNHEIMLQEAIDEEDERLDLWVINGGGKTLTSFGVLRPADIPAHYRDFFAGLAYYAEAPGYFLVHAGLDFRQGDPLARRQAMLWIRDWYDDLDRDWLGDRVIVHGHTPQENWKITRQLELLDRKPVLNIDAGCFRYDMLCAFDMTHRKLYFQGRLD